MRPAPARTAWVEVACPRPNARLRLICLPFAGGGARSYREWPAHLPDDVEVVPIQPPGRENRLGESAVDSMELLASQLLDELVSYLDRPFALFGHSMGALVAFELARRLRPVGLEPVHLFASGHKAPHLPDRRPADRHTLPDREFVAAIQTLNGIPPEVLASEDLMSLLLPTLRSDFKLVETYVCHPQAPLRCPVTVFGGLQDTEASRAELEAWSCHTTGRFAAHLLPGGHFFVNSAHMSILRLVTAEVGGGAHESRAG